MQSPCWQGVTCLILGVLTWAALGVLLPQYSASICVALLLGVILAWLLLRMLAKEIDPTYTLGDAALRMTALRECREAGYRFTHNEIFWKVRASLAGCCGVPYARIKPETTFRELFWN